MDRTTTSVRTTSITSRQPVPLVVAEGCAHAGHQWTSAGWTGVFGVASSPR